MISLTRCWENDMSAIKVLTVQFDVTHLDDEAIHQLRRALIIQSEEFPVSEDAIQVTCADLLNSSVREVSLEDT